jgi:hypothetical protein
VYLELEYSFPLSLNVIHLPEIILYLFGLVAMCEVVKDEKANDISLLIA